MTAAERDGGVQGERAASDDEAAVPAANAAEPDDEAETSTADSAAATAIADPQAVEAVAETRAQTPTLAADERALADAVNSDVGDVYLLQWLTRVEDALDATSLPPTFADEAPVLVRVFLRICGAEPVPDTAVWAALRPARFVRHSIARALVRL